MNGRLQLLSYCQDASPFHSPKVGSSLATILAAGQNAQIVPHHPNLPFQACVLQRWRHAIAGILFVKKCWHCNLMSVKAEDNRDIFDRNRESADKRVLKRSRRNLLQVDFKDLVTNPTPPCVVPALNLQIVVKDLSLLPVLKDPRSYGQQSWLFCRRHAKSCLQQVQSFPQCRRRHGPQQLIRLKAIKNHTQKLNHITLVYSGTLMACCTSPCFWCCNPQKKIGWTWCLVHHLEAKWGLVFVPQSPRLSVATHTSIAEKHLLPLSTSTTSPVLRLQGAHSEIKLGGDFAGSSATQLKGQVPS